MFRKSVSEGLTTFFPLISPSCSSLRIDSRIGVRLTPNSVASFSSTIFVP